MQWGLLIIKNQDIWHFDSIIKNLRSSNTPVSIVWSHIARKAMSPWPPSHSVAVTRCCALLRRSRPTPDDWEFPHSPYLDLATQWNALHSTLKNRGYVHLSSAFCAPLKIGAWIETRNTSRIWAHLRVNLSPVHNRVGFSFEIKKFTWQ